MSTSLSYSLATLEDARPWIGRRLVLRKPVGELDAGTPCVVMCSVDFGEGLLLWIKTEDAKLRDVGQFEPAVIQEHFYMPRLVLDDSRAAPSQSLERAAKHGHPSKAQPVIRPTPARGLRERGAKALRRVFRFGVELARSFEAAREAAHVAERYLRMSENDLAARGLTRLDVSKQIRDILCRNI